MPRQLLNRLRQHPENMGVSEAIIKSRASRHQVDNRVVRRSGASAEPVAYAFAPADQREPAASTSLRGYWPRTVIDRRLGVSRRRTAGSPGCRARPPAGPPDAKKRL